jgi:hypothetical protein
MSPENESAQVTSGASTSAWIRGSGTVSNLSPKKVQVTSATEFATALTDSSTAAATSFKPWICNRHLKQGSGLLGRFWTRTAQGTGLQTSVLICLHRGVRGADALAYPIILLGLWRPLLHVSVGF